MTQPKAKPSFLQRLWRELLEPILFAVVITQFVATLVGVDGVSMMPNLRNGERVLVPKYETWLHKAGIGQFQRGDVLVFKPPTEFFQANPYQYKSFFGLWNYRPFLIKRLVGLPGDRIRLDKGVVFVNGARLNGSYTTDFWQKQGCWDTESEIANNAQAGPFLTPQKEFVVPSGHYFVMGDNRTEGGSEDSRLFGPVPLRDIAGRAAVAVWPIVRQAQASYNCNLGGKQAVEFSGPNELNWRLLNRPPAFRELGGPLLSR